jgi:hypothetical protein
MGQSQFQISDRDADPFFAKIEGQRRAGARLTRFFSLLHIEYLPGYLPIPQLCL